MTTAEALAALGLERPGWQADDLTTLETKDVSANWSEMGCVTGEAQITVLCGSSVRYWTLEQAYLGFNKLHSYKTRNWKSKKPYYTLAMVDGRVRHHRILAILYQGLQSVVKIQFATGRVLRCTPDHEIFTKDGWIEAQDLVKGSLVAVKGQKGTREFTSSAGRRKLVKAGKGYERQARVIAGAAPGQHVHHLDEDRSNDNPSNLLVTTHSEHSRLHARDQIGSYDIVYDRVVRVTGDGYDKVYDIVMDEPYHSFVANGVVVHNCYKTSTGLWLIQSKMAEANIEKPSVLVITTATGKGTYFKLAPKILEGWTIFNVHTTGVNIFMQGREVKIPQLDFVPKEIDMPHLIVTHYNVFARCNKGKFEDDEKGRPDFKRPKKWTQGDHLLDRNWDFVLIDEAHRIKNYEGKWTMNIKKVKSPRRHIMTGTGFINRPDEIWSLLNFLDKREYSSYWRFRDYFCEIDDWDGFSKVIGTKPERKDEFRALVRSLGPRRTLDEVMPSIQKAIFVPVDVDLNKTQREMYDALKSELRALDQQGTPLYSPNVLSLLQRLRQICVATPEVLEDFFDEKAQRRRQVIRLVEPSSKLDAVMELIEGLEWDEDARQPVVVFSNFVDPLKLLAKRLDNGFNHRQGNQPKPIPYLWMKQSDNEQERFHKWHELFPTKEYRVFLSTLQLGSESIDLTPARHVIFLDRSWSPKDNDQGIGRIRRPGQAGEPVVININAKRTTDQLIEDRVKQKKSWFQDIFGNENGN